MDQYLSNEASSKGDHVRTSKNGQHLNDQDSDSGRKHYTKGNFTVDNSCLVNFKDPSEKNLHTLTSRDIEGNPRGDKVNNV